MDLTPISTLPEPTKVISLSVARNKYRPGKCQHCGQMTRINV